MPHATPRMPRSPSVTTPTLAPTMSTNAPTSARRAKVVEGPFTGQYGEWYLTQGDVEDVTFYRSCLLASACSLATATALSLTTGVGIPPRVYDVLALLSSLAFGGALQTIHIYVRPLHTGLKVLWVLGLLGGLALGVSPLTATPEGVSGVMMSAWDHPALLLAFGWQFVALTGLFFKEAICFGRLEALLLMGVMPVLAGGHFLSLLPVQAEQATGALFAGLFVFFALRKFTQASTDDLGDKSVFQYLDSKK